MKVSKFDLIKSSVVYTVAYLGFHFEGFKIFLEKWGYLHGASHAFARGVRGHTPPRIFLKWCNLVRFEEYFAKIL